LLNQGCSARPARQARSPCDPRRQTPATAGAGALAPKKERGQDLLLTDNATVGRLAADRFFNLQRERLRGRPRQPAIPPTLRLNGAKGCRRYTPRPTFPATSPMRSCRGHLPTCPVGLAQSSSAQGCVCPARTDRHLPTRRLSTAKRVPDHVRPFPTGLFPVPPVTVDCFWDYREVPTQPYDEASRQTRILTKKSVGKDASFDSSYDFSSGHFFNGGVKSCDGRLAALARLTWQKSP
jgi:hypothetical protein